MIWKHVTQEIYKTIYQIWNLATRSRMTPYELLRRSTFTQDLKPVHNLAKLNNKIINIVHYQKIINLINYHPNYSIVDSVTLPKSLIRGILLLCRNVVGVFYSPSWLSHRTLIGWGESYPSVETQSVYSADSDELAFAKLYDFGGGPRGLMVKAMDSWIVVREFVLQSCYYVHFRANTLGKCMNPLILPAMD